MAVGAEGEKATCVYHEEGFFGGVVVSSFRFGEAVAQLPTASRAGQQGDGLQRQATVAKSAGDTYLIGQEQNRWVPAVFAGHHPPLRGWRGCLYLMGLNVANRQLAQELGLRRGPYSA